MSRYTITITDNETQEDYIQEVDGYYLGFFEEGEDELMFDDMYDSLSKQDLDFIIDEAIKTKMNDFDCPDGDEHNNTDC